MVVKGMVVKGVVPTPPLLSRLVFSLCSSNRPAEAADLLLLASSPSVSSSSSSSSDTATTPTATTTTPPPPTTTTMTFSPLFSHVVEHCLRPSLLPKALLLVERARSLLLPLDLPSCNHLIASLGPTKHTDKIDDVLG